MLISYAVFSPQLWYVDFNIEYLLAYFIQSPNHLLSSITYWKNVSSYIALIDVIDYLRMLWAQKI